MIRQKLLLLMAIWFLSSCTYKPMVGAPWMQDILRNGPDGPNNFRLGWRDGCETGISATSNAFQRSFYKFKQNYELAQNPTYYKGWKTAFTYCQRYVLQYLKRRTL